MVLCLWFSDFVFLCCDFNCWVVSGVLMIVVVCVSRVCGFVGVSVVWLQV